MNGTHPIHARGSSGPATPRRTANILLVDDVEANLTALSALLQYDDVDLFQAVSGEQALELLLIHDFALAIIDVQMPEMNGFELATFMRGIERTRRVPIIFITAGNQNQQHRFKGYEAGAVDFLYKPIEPDILRYKAAVFLELYRSRQEMARQRDELSRSEQSLAAELRAARRLQDLSTRLIQADELDALYAQILETIVALTDSDCATLHILSRPRGDELQLLGHRGVSPPMIKFLDRVRSASAAPCAVALRSGKRVLVPDVFTCEFMTGSLAQQVFLQNGIRAAQSTPLCSRTGELLGTISNGWRKLHEPAESEWRSLDIVARQAADLIERTQATQALRETMERLRFMAESMPQKIFTAKPNGEMDSFNGKWMEFTGLPAAQIEGWGWTQTVHPGDLEENIRRWKNSVETGGMFEIEHRLRRSDGVYRWHLSRARAMRDKAGTISMWIGSATDIHEQKETEAELRRLNEDLNHFAFAASHDLQEPLRIVSSFSELFLQSYRGQFEGDAKTYIEYIKQGVKRMRELLADLLSYTQVTQDKGAISETADLNRALEFAIQNLKTAIEENGAELAAGKLPQVCGHETHFVQLFQNLIGNALKYRGKNPPRIRISVEARNREYRIGVADNGIGIAPAHHQQIFGVFKRLHGSDIPGTGIGLSICQRVVERYGGRIWVESEPEQGATFYFTLPFISESGSKSAA